MSATDKESMSVMSASRAFVVFLLLAIAVAPSSAQGPGFLDPSFGGGAGVVITGFSAPSPNDWCFGLAVQPDSKVVAVGRVGTSGSGTASWLICRYQPDGTLDAGFGTGGSVTLFSGNTGYTAANDVQIDGLGQILVAGVAPPASGNASGVFCVVRLTNSGTLDGSFGSGGVVRTPFAANVLDAEARALALQVDGRVVVAGRLHKSTGYQLALVRYQPNGSIDKSFGSKGVATLPSGNDPFMPRGTLAIQLDGKIVVAGEASLSQRWALFRCNSSGTMDTTFGNGGVATSSFPGLFSLWGLSLQPDGRILTCGSYQTSSSASAYPLVVRQLANGSADMSFGSGGSVVLLTEGGARDCVVQADGRVVVCGSLYSTSGDSHMTTVRLLLDGNLDPSFGSGGFGQPTDPNGLLSREGGLGIALDQATGHIVVVGQAHEAPFGNGGQRFAVARWLGN